MFADSSVAIVEARYYDVESSLQAVERSGKELQYVVEWIRDPPLLEAMAENARLSAKPQATDRIAEDLWALLQGEPATPCAVTPVSV